MLELKQCNLSHCTIYLYIGWEGGARPQGGQAHRWTLLCTHKFAINSMTYFFFILAPLVHVFWVNPSVHPKKRMRQVGPSDLTRSVVYWVDGRLHSRLFPRIDDNAAIPVPPRKASDMTHKIGPALDEKSCQTRAWTPQLPMTRSTNLQ